MGHCGGLRSRFGTDVGALDPVASEFRHRACEHGILANFATRGGLLHPTTSAFDWRSLLPGARWLPGYRAGWLKSDLVAGVTLAAYAIPVSMAYASLAGLPPHYGIYGYLLGGLCYAGFGTSRQLAIGPTSAIALMVGVTVAEMAQGDAARWAAVVARTGMQPG